jgi:hypothetical protein
MSQNSDALATIRERNKRKRLTGWIVIYILLVTVFIFTVYWQAKRINTLNFASGELQLSTSRTKYTVGDKIRYTLKNGLSQPITLLNTCPKEPLYVYSWTNNSWVRIHDLSTASTCIGVPEQRTIPIGGFYTQSFANWPNLFNKPGIYRIVALATNYTALPYADFQVVAKPVASKIQTQTQVIIQKVITPVYITVPRSGGDGGGGGDN